MNFSRIQLGTGTNWRWCFISSDEPAGIFFKLICPPIWRFVSVSFPWFHGFFRVCYRIFVYFAPYARSLLAVPILLSVRISVAIRRLFYPFLPATSSTYSFIIAAAGCSCSWRSLPEFFHPRAGAWLRGGAATCSEPLVEFDTSRRNLVLALHDPLPTNTTANGSTADPHERHLIPKLPRSLLSAVFLKAFIFYEAILEFSEVESASCLLQLYEPWSLVFCPPRKKKHAGSPTFPSFPCIPQINRASSGEKTNDFLATRNTNWGVC